MCNYNPNTLQYCIVLFLLQIENIKLKTKAKQTYNLTHMLRWKPPVVRIYLWDSIYFFVLSVSALFSKNLLSVKISSLSLWNKAYRYSTKESVFNTTVSGI